MTCKETLYRIFADSQQGKDRARWMNRATFIIATVGYCVGLGNFWRFPYLCFKWGGALFFVPYFFCLFTIGLPVTLMELSLGQKFQRGDIGVFRGIHPRLTGVGLASIISAYTITAYYNVIIAWALVYLICSFMAPLPWGTDYTNDILGNHKKCPDLYITQEFFFKDLTKLYKDDCTPVDTSSMVFDESIFQWEVYLATFVTWIICYFCMWKGVNSSSYVVWVTVPLPVLFIIIMVINNLQLEGASKGVAMYLQGLDLEGNKPDLIEKLSQGNMWSEACGQIFFSLGICMGSMTSYASYNPINKPIISDAFIIGMTNSTISFVAGFAVFSVVGYLNEIESPVAGNTASIGLAFIAYPAAIETMSAKNVWSFILSVTLFMLGIDSAFSMLEAASTVIQDHPKFKDMPRKLIALILVVIGAILSIFFCFNWGFSLFDVVDHYLNVYLMLLLGVMECFGVGWIYELADVRAAGDGAKKSTTVLFAGYWALTLIIAPVSIFAFADMAYVGIIIFWAAMIFVWIISFVVYGGKFGDWYSNVFLYGVRKISRSMTKLSKTAGQTGRSWWEPIFEFWWGFSIKYVVPFALTMLLLFSFKADITSPYGGYHAVWQTIGWIIPGLGFIAFIIPVFSPPGPEPFDHDVDAAFKEDDYSGVGAASTFEAQKAGGKSVEAEMATKAPTV